MPAIIVCQSCGGAYWEDRHQFGLCAQGKAIEAVESVKNYQMIEEIAKAIGSARQDAPNEAYGLRMRLSFDEQKRAARAVLALTSHAPQPQEEGASNG